MGYVADDKSRDKDGRKLQQVFETWLRVNGKLEEYAAARITSQWETIVGKAISRHTTAIYFSNKTMYLRISSSIVRSELLMLRSQLIDVINQKAGIELITDIVIQ